MDGIVLHTLLCEIFIFEWNYWLQQKFATLPDDDVSIQDVVECY